MRLVAFTNGSGPQIGRVDGETVIPLTEGWTGPASMAAVLATGRLDELMQRGDARQAIALAGLSLLPPVFDPPRIFCVGVNYEEHRLETGRERSAAPTIFMRTPQSQLAAGAPIHVPADVSTRVDYEGEIAVVVGRGGRHIERSDAMAHVAFYSAYNDVSVRDWQVHTSQWTPGKNFDGTGAFGPWLVTPDAMPATMKDIRLQTRLNGRVMQDATADMMIFGIDEQIAYLSTFTALLPGDVIVTGTPGGVGNKRTPQVFLKPGDVVEIEVTGVGVLRNPVA